MPVTDDGRHVFDDEAARTMIAAQMATYRDPLVRKLANLIVGLDLRGLLSQADAETLAYARQIQAGTIPPPQADAIEYAIKAGPDHVRLGERIGLAVAAARRSGSVLLERTVNYGPWKPAE